MSWLYTIHATKLNDPLAPVGGEENLGVLTTIGNEGAPIPVVFGSVDLEQSGCAWYSLRSEGGSAYIRLLLALCYGQLDSLYSIRLNEVPLYLGELNLDTSIQVDAPNLLNENEGIAGTLRFRKGSRNQQPITTLANFANADLPTGSNAMPGYRGVALLYFDDCNLGGWCNEFPAVITRVGRTKTTSAGVDIWRSDISTIELTLPEAPRPSYKTMNATHIVYDCLTDPYWGLGFEQSRINLSSFESVALRTFDEDIGLCMSLQRNTPIVSFIQNICRYIDAQVYFDSNDKLKIKAIRRDYNRTTLPRYDESNTKEVSGFKRAQIYQSPNTVTTQYTDIRIEQGASTITSITLQDLSLLQAVAQPIRSSSDYSGAIHSELASRLALRDLTALSQQLIYCNLNVFATARTLELGDVFLLTWPDYGIDSVVMRISGIQYSDNINNMISIECVQDVFNTERPLRRFLT